MDTQSLTCFLVGLVDPGNSFHFVFRDSVHFGPLGQDRCSHGLSAGMEYRGKAWRLQVEFRGQTLTISVRFLAWSQVFPSKSDSWVVDRIHYLQSAGRSCRFPAGGAPGRSRSIGATSGEGACRRLDVQNHLGGGEGLGSEILGRNWEGVLESGVSSICRRGEGLVPKQ